VVQNLRQSDNEENMSVECSFFVIAADRYDALRADPKAVTDEALLRGMLGYLINMSQLKPGTSEAEVLTEIRAKRGLEMYQDPKKARRMVEHYARIDALVDAALARGDRETPLQLGSTWQYLNEILTEGEEPAPLERFIDGGLPLGEHVGYGPASLQAPAAVSAFAAYLDLWSIERFSAAAKVLRVAMLPKEFLAEYDALEALMGGNPDAEFFLRFKSYIVKAAAVRAGMLIWID
jgi:Domain of unknown function (DUF1877)